MTTHPHQRDTSIPPPSGRWTPARKGEVCRQVLANPALAAEAMERFGITADELAAWVRRYQEFGEAGLRQTRIQELRCG